MTNFLKSLFVKGIEIDPAGATSAQVLSYNGTKFVPTTAGVGALGLDNLSDVVITTPATTQFVRYNGTNWVNATIVAGDVPTLNQNTTGSAATVTGNAQGNITSVGTLTALTVSGNLLVGATSLRSVGGSYQTGVASQTFLEQGSGGLTAYTSVLNRADSNALRFVLGKSRGTAAGAVTALVNNDGIADLYFAGADGTTLDPIAARIGTSVDGTVATGSVPGRIVFATTSVGASVTAERMRITNAGLVGIGVTPTSMLHVVNTTAANKAFVVKGAAAQSTDFFDIQESGGASRFKMLSTGIIHTFEGIEVGSLGTGNRYAGIDFIGDATYTDYGLRLLRRNTGANAASELAHRGTGTLSIIAQEAAPMLFSTSNTERMRIDSAGNVGIGTTTPSTALDVVGTTTLKTVKAGSGAVAISSTSYQSGFATSTYNTTTPHGFATGDTVAVTGITPSSWNRTATITVNSSTQFYFSLFNGSTGGAYSSGGTATGPPSTLYVDVTNDRIGIGTSSPTEKLDVAGNIALTGSVVFEGATANTFETTLAVTDPLTADRTITLPDASGTVALTNATTLSSLTTVGTITSGTIDGGSA